MNGYKFVTSQAILNELSINCSPYARSTEFQFASIDPPKAFAPKIFITYPARTYLSATSTEPSLAHRR